MEQSIAYRSPPAVAAVGPEAAGPDRPVMLRIPDCTRQVGAEEHATGSAGLLAAAWITRVSSMVRGLASFVRRPRGVMAIALWGVLALGAVAVFDATRQRGKDKDARPEKFVQADHSSTSEANAAPQFKTAEQVGNLSDAPSFLPAGNSQLRANQPARIEISQVPTPAGNQKSSSEKARPPSPCARLEQRIDRVSTQY